MNPAADFVFEFFVWVRAIIVEGLLVGGLVQPAANDSGAHCGVEQHVSIKQTEFDDEQEVQSP